MDEYLRLTHEQVAQALADSEHTVLLVDFDETLWLRNSTEMFLNLSRPRGLAAGLLQLLDMIRPWRVLFGRRRARFYRDWIRVGTIRVLMPWVKRSWTRQAPALGAGFANEPLVRLIRGMAPIRVVIVSNGFRALIAPLLEGMGLEGAELVAAPLRSGGTWRARGKMSALVGVVSEDELDHAILITDHEDDAELLARVGTGILCVWPEARYERAFQRQPWKMRANR